MAPSKREGRSSPDPCGPRRRRRPAGRASLPVALGRSRERDRNLPASGRDARRSGLSRPRHSHGRPSGRGRRPGPAGRPRAPPHRLRWRHSTSARAGPAPQARSADGGSPRPASRTHPATCDVHTVPRRAQGSQGCASAGVAAARSTSARQPAAGARPRRRWGGSEAPCAPQRPMGLQQVACVGGP